MTASPLAAKLPSAPISLVFIGMILPACRTVEPDPNPASDSIGQAAFVLLDKDADGKVSPREMAAYQHQEGLAEIDLDNDKRVSPVEWKAARPSAPSDDGAFARLDLDQDGFIAEDEAVAHITGRSTYLAAFKTMDKSGDGNLHWEEYEAGDPASLNVTLASSGSVSAPGPANP